MERHNVFIMDGILNVIKMTYPLNWFIGSVHSLSESQLTIFVELTKWVSNSHGTGRDPEQPK